MGHSASIIARKRAVARVALMDGDIELVADLLVRQLKQSGIKDDSLGIADFCDGLDHRMKQRITSGCLSRGIAH